MKLIIECIQHDYRDIIDWPDDGLFLLAVVDMLERRYETEFHSLITHHQATKVNPEDSDARDAAQASHCMGHPDYGFNIQGKINRELTEFVKTHYISIRGQIATFLEK